MVFKYLCALVLWTRVAAELEGLSINGLMLAVAQRQPNKKEKWPNISSTKSLKPKYLL